MQLVDFALPEKLDVLPGKNALEKIHKYYERFDELDDTGIAVYKMIMDADNNPVDAILVYSNKTTAEIIHRTVEEIVGYSYLKFLEDATAKWLNVGVAAAYFGKTISASSCVSSIKQYMNFRAKQAFAPGYVLYQFSMITPIPDLGEQVSKRWRTDEIILSLSHLLRASMLTEARIDKALAELALQIKPTNLYIAEHYNVECICAHEWHAREAEPLKELINCLDMEGMKKAWEQLLTKATAFSVTDISQLRQVKSPVYDFFAKRKVQSLIIAPYFYQGDIQGVVVAENPTISTDLDAEMLLEMSASLFGNELRINNLVSQMDYMGRHDALTRINNRNAMEQDVAKLVGQDVSLGLLFADMNGLKTVNDNQGHAAGDMLLQRVAKILSQIFGADTVYRIGGDEFVVLEQDVDAPAFRCMVQDLQAEAKLAGISLSIGWCYVTESVSLREEMKLADKDMYMAKQEYYKAKQCEKGDS